jgi:hypothetical protein
VVEEARWIPGDLDPLTDEEVKWYAGVAKTVHARHTQLFGPDSQSIGGALWYRGAKTAHDYLTGRMEPAVFIDLTFDLVHNGGTLLNKVYGVYQHLLWQFLDWRKEASLDDMLAVCPMEIKQQYGLVGDDEAPSRMPWDWLPVDLILRYSYAADKNWLAYETDWLRIYTGQVVKEPLALGTVVQWWRGLTPDDVEVIVAADLVKAEYVQCYDVQPSRGWPFRWPAR